MTRTDGAFTSRLMMALVASYGAVCCGGSRNEAVGPSAETASMAASPPPAVAAAPTSEALQPPSAAPERDPKALAALRHMGAFLRQQRAFIVRSDDTTDQVLENGQKIELAESVELRVRRPDRFTAKVDSDRKQRAFYYDGKAFTLFGERVGYYAQVPAPPTIEETVDALQARLDLELPLVDLFRWGLETSEEDEIIGAMDIGPSRVRGIDTEHYAFRRADVDFQLWIERGEQPLPRKLVITTLSDPSQPEHSKILSWELNAKLADSEFTFVPPAGAQRIVFYEAGPSARQGNPR